MRITGFLIIFLGMTFTVAGQQSVVDSLKHELENAHDTTEAQILNNLAFNSFLIGQDADAEKYAEEALEKARNRKQRDNEAIALKNLAIVYSYTDRVEKGLKTYEKAIKQFEETKNYEQLSRVYTNMSNIFLQRGDFLKVHEYLDIAKTYCDDHDIDNPALLGSLSNFYQLIGMYDKSLEYILESLELAEKVGDKEGVGYAYNALGGIYAKTGERDKAIEAYEEALQNYVELEQDNHIAVAYNNLGSIYGEKKEFGKALEYCKKSLMIKEEIKYPEGIVFSHIAIGDIYSMMEEENKAIEHYNTAASISGENKMSHLLSEVQSKLGVLYYTLKNHSLSAYNLRSSNEIAVKNGNMVTSRENYFYLAKIDSTQGNFKGALLNYQLYKAASDSIYNKERTRQRQEMQIRFETEKKEQQIELLNNNLLLSEKDGDIQRLYKNIAIGGGIITVLILILLINRMRIRRRYFKQKEDLIAARELQLASEQKLKEEEAKKNQLLAEKLQAELEHKNRELSTFSMYVHQKNALLTELKDQVAELSKYADDDTQQKLKAINSGIRQNIDLEEDWNNIKLHFEDVYPGFFHGLNEKFPKLTQLELKHCAYLKMNISSKEIARILNVAPRSVQMSHYRMKKKLNLSPEDSLSDFIHFI